MEYSMRKQMWLVLRGNKLYLLVSHAVVIWSDMLGGVLTGQEPLPWSGPIFTHQISGERRETRQTTQ